VSSIVVFKVTVSREVIVWKKKKCAHLLWFVISHAYLELLQIPGEILLDVLPQTLRFSEIGVFTPTLTNACPTHTWLDMKFHITGL
jgi:hypothetical protein